MWYVTAKVFEVPSTLLTQTLSAAKNVNYSTWQIPATIVEVQLVWRVAATVVEVPLTLLTQTLAAAKNVDRSKFHSR